MTFLLSFLFVALYLLVPLSAYLLVAHGSRDPRPQQAVESLAQLIRQRQPQFAYSSGKQDNPFPPIVGTAFLELASMPLHESIRQFALRVRSTGQKQLEILPLFLLPGVHVQEDLPAEVAQAQKALGDEVQLRLQPHLGAHPGLVSLMGQQGACVTTTGRILLSHGSRRPGSLLPVEEMAARLKALPAYWSVSPSLETQVERLAKAGHSSIFIFPYFLFAGGITDAIAQQVDQLRHTFPHVDLLLGEPLGVTPQLADLIMDGVAL